MTNSVSVILFAPLIALGAFRWRALIERELLPLTVLLVITSLECIRSTHPTDAAHCVLIYATSLALASGAARSHSFLVASVLVSTVLCALLPVYLVVAGGQLGDLGFSQQIYAIFGAAYLHMRVPRRSLWLFGEVALCTIRAAGIGLAAGLSLLAIRRPVLRFCAMAAAVGLVLMVDEYAPASSSIVVPDRSDIYGRFRSIGEDGGSGRTEIWTAIAEDLVSHGFDTTFLIGHSPPDVDYYLGSLLPDRSTEQRNERCLNSHNVALELFLGLGIIVIPLLGWNVVSIWRGLRSHPCVLPLAVTLGAVGAANNMFDLAGGSACIALLFVMTKCQAGCIRSSTLATAPQPLAVEGNRPPGVAQ